MVDIGQFTMVDSGWFAMVGIGWFTMVDIGQFTMLDNCLLYTSPSPRDKRQSRMPSSA